MGQDGVGQDLICTLVRMGISEAAANSYLTILHRQRAGDHGVVLGSGMKDGISRDSILGLRDKRLVVLDKDAVGRSVVRAVDPRVAFRALYARLLWTLCPSEAEISLLPTCEIEFLREYHTLCLELEEKLGNLYRQPDGSSTLAMIEKEHVSEELAMCIRGARETIRGITAPAWAPLVSLVWESLKERIANGVKYHRLADEVTFVAFGDRINRRDVNEVGVHLRLVPLSRILSKFFVIDHDAAIIFWPPGPGPEFPLEASVTTIREILSECVESFDSLWRTAVPSEQMFPFMESLRDDFVHQCVECVGAAVGKYLGEGLFDYGKFFFSDSAGPQGADKIAVDRLHQCGIVRQSCDGSGTVIPNVVHVVQSRITEIMIAG